MAVDALTKGDRFKLALFSREITGTVVRLHDERDGAGYLIAIKMDSGETAAKQSQSKFVKI